jgi:CelD/BcsL family acetyltransferase involved in cellulose biosynthesis
MEQGVSHASAMIEPRVESPPAKAAARSGRLTVEIKNSLELEPGDARALEALIDSCPRVGVFLSTSWLSGFFLEPPDGCETLLVMLRDGDILRGVVPIGMRRAGSHVRVRLLGGGLGSDRVDLLAARGFETACADMLMSWLAEAFGRRGFIVELRDVPAESPLWGAVHRFNDERERRLAFQPRDIHTLPYLDLAEFSARKAGGAVSRGPSLDKHRRWLEKRGRLRIETLQDPGEVLIAFDALTAFLHARWRGHANGSALDHPRAQRFHRHVMPLLLGEGRLRLIRLTSDMRTIAVFYGLALGRWRGYYLAGYDREWAGRIHLGQITLAAAIDLASREGAAEFDFLKGVERVKYLWPVRERSSLDADAYSEHSTSQFSRARHAMREAAGAVAKSARDLVTMVTER